MVIVFYCTILRRIPVFQENGLLFCFYIHSDKGYAPPYIVIDIFFYINTVKTIKWISPFFLHFLKDYTNSSKITNLRSIYHPERRDYDVAKMRFKTGAGKT